MSPRSSKRLMRADILATLALAVVIVTGLYSAEYFLGVTASVRTQSVYGSLQTPQKQLHRAASSPLRLRKAAASSSVKSAVRKTLRRVRPARSSRSSVSR